MRATSRAGRGDHIYSVSDILRGDHIYSVSDILRGDHIYSVSDILRGDHTEGRKEVFPWTVIGLLFLLWTVNCVLFSSWTVNWPPLIFSVIRELSFIFLVNRELESFIFPVIRDWHLFFFREPWILPIIFVNFPIFPQKSICHLSLWSVTGSSWSTLVYCSQKYDDG